VRWRADGDPWGRRASGSRLAIERAIIDALLVAQTARMHHGQGPGRVAPCSMIFGTVALRAEWNENFGAALLLGDDGDIVGWLRQEIWYERGCREPSVAWIASRLRGEDAERKGMAIFPLEVPARLADTEERRAALVDRARVELARRPDDQREAAAAAAEPLDTERQHQLIDRLLSAWTDVFGELERACARGVAEGAHDRFRRLAELLFWTYTVDEVLNTAFRRLPDGARERASVRTDGEAERVIVHNRELLKRHADVDYDPGGERALDAFHQRQLDGKPYAHWSSFLLAGVFNPRFFGAVAWVRGKLTHEGIDEPIELRQMSPGGQPRWKWKRGNAVVASTRQDRGRLLYEEELAEKDVLGLFGHLIDVFVDAKWLLYRLAADAERAGDL
jgi:hypothetical protein